MTELDDMSCPVKEEWEQIHHELKRLAEQQAEHDYEQGKWLVRALRETVHLRLGYGSFCEYVERLFGYSPRMVGERLRVAEALVELPQMSRALESGRLCWSVARELTRVATEHTEAEWLKAAKGRAVREVEQMVSGRRPGSRPSDPADKQARRHVLRFEVSAETMATFREAVAKLRREAAGPLDEDEALLLMARGVLGGPSEPGRASYQIAMTVCELCGRGWQQGRGELLPVGPEVVEMAECDAQHIGSVAGAPEHGCGDEGNTHVGIDGGRGLSAGATGSSESRTVVTGGSDNVGSANTHGMGTGGSDNVGSASTHVGNECCGQSNESAPGQRRSRRARQSVPPAVRRQVVRRERSRCAVPGCRHSVFLDVHHLNYRADGSCDADDLVLLCPVHHRAAHKGFLIIEGSPGAGLRFYHADGTEYGMAVSPQALQLHEMALSALRSLGFGEAQARWALKQIRTRVDEKATMETVIKEALAVLAT